MRKLFFALAIILAPFALQAQIKTPASSPKGVVSQVVGLTDVEIVYSRPSARGRAVFGNLVPFGKLWRTGANENTIISFSDDIVIDGKTLKKGKYALYTIPRIESWDVIFYKTTDNWGLPEEYSEANVALKTTVKEESLSKAVETFTVGINNIDPNSNYAHLDIAWENSSVSMKFDVPTAKIASESMERVLSGPTAADYFAAAQYLYQIKGDINKSREYVDKALDLTKELPFYYNRLKSLIQARQGDKNGAISTAKVSLAASEAAGNQDYVKMNKDSISEWSR